MLKTKTIHKIIDENPGDFEAIRITILDIVGDKKSDLMPQLTRLKPFFVAEEVSKIVESIIQENPENWIRYVETAREYISDKKLRERLLTIHKAMPWLFYNHIDAFRDLFTSDFFSRVFTETQSLMDTELFKIFQIYHSDSAMSGFFLDFQELLKEKIGTTKIEARVAERREAGFACGGMDKNFDLASQKGEGLCLVNDQFIAKRYHRKGADKAVKISFISSGSGVSENGYPIWEDFIYAPSEDQHVAISDAILNGETAIQIENLIIRPARPLIGKTSQQVWNQFNSSMEKKD
jgi:hypothetical protein